MVFDDNIVDSTLDGNGISHLQEKIKISMDGTTFVDLDARDVVSIQGNRLVIIFHDMKKSGTVKVKILAGAITDEHQNAWNKEFIQVIAYNAPDLTGFLYSNAESELTFEDNDLWRSKVRNIEIYNNSTSAVRTLTSSEYTITAGKLTIIPGIFEKDQFYEIYINAEGYSSKYIYAVAHKTSEVLYMTAPVITTENGITAKINVLNTDFYGILYGSMPTQSVIFQLMNGNTPVSIVAAAQKTTTGTYSATFNVSDAATNPNYSVRAFIVSKYDTDYTSVGTNMATVVSQTELILKQIELESQMDY